MHKIIQIIKKIIRIIEIIIDVIERPILKELPFFVWTIFLMIFPTLVNAYLINGRELSFSYIQMTNRFGASFPYVLFLPFFLSYLIVLIQFLFRKSILKFLIYVVLLLLVFLNLFLLLNFSTMVSPMIFTLLSETTGAETDGFLSTYILSNGTLLSFVLTMAIVLLICITEKYKDKLQQFNFNRYIVKYPAFIVVVYLFYRGILCFLYFFTLFSCDTPEEVEVWSHGFKYETNTVSVSTYSFYDFRSQKKEVSRFYEMISELKKESVTSDVDSVDIILVIGESYNKYHAGIYGYFLDTTPFMTEQKEKGNLVVCEDAISPFNMTSFVIKNIMSTNLISRHQRWSEYPFFPILFKNSGFSVYFWDNQMVLSGGDVSDFSLNALIHNNNISVLSYTKVNDKIFQYDGDLVADFVKKNLLSGGKNLVLFHLQGQHFEAKDKYPRGDMFDIFSIDSYNRPHLTRSMKQEIADYDNATRYNDHVIRKIADTFNNREAVLVYVADHGEEVYDYRDFIGRTHEDSKSIEALKYQYDVPLVIWFSDKYIRRNSHVVTTIKSNANKRIMTDGISHLLLGLGGIRTCFYNSSSDFSTNDYKEKKRIVQNVIDYDYQMTLKNKE